MPFLSLDGLRAMQRLGIIRPKDLWSQTQMAHAQVLRTARAAEEYPHGSDLCRLETTLSPLPAHALAIRAFMAPLAVHDRGTASIQKAGVQERLEAAADSTWCNSSLTNGFKMVTHCAPSCTTIDISLPPPGHLLGLTRLAPGVPVRTFPARDTLGRLEVRAGKVCHRQ